LLGETIGKIGRIRARSFEKVKERRYLKEEKKRDKPLRSKRRNQRGCPPNRGEERTQDYLASNNPNPGRGGKNQQGPSRGLTNGGKERTTIHTSVQGTKPPKDLITRVASAVAGVEKSVNWRENPPKPIKKTYLIHASTARRTEKAWKAIAWETKKRYQERGKTQFF